MNNTFEDLKNRFSALGFQCVIRSNYPNGGYSETYAHFTNKDLATTIVFEYHDDDDPYMQFVYTPKCLGSELKSTPLYQRENYLDRAVKEYQAFNDMALILANNDY